MSLDTVGSRLRIARQSNGWSVKAVEQITEGRYKAGIVSAYERGERRITVDRLQGLAALYGVSIYSLIPEDGQP